ncbi:MAG: amino acid ABC transporter permease [Clostridia bacterium]|nr:amino acid ABC transporter permease [Clostridia bacterium]
MILAKTTAWDIFTNSLIKEEGYKDVLQGLMNTLEIAILGLIIGIAIGTIIAIVKVIPKYKKLPRILEKIADIYVGFFRGTPMIVQLLIGKYILLAKVPIDDVLIAVVIFGLNSGAYVSEIMRSGIQSVDVGQLEAGRALGMSYASTMMRVIIPQAIKNILPTLGNEFIVLVKETSVVSFIAVIDITKAFRSMADATYEYIVPYLMLALIYLIIVMLITVLIKIMERRLKKSDRN